MHLIDLPIEENKRNFQDIEWATPLHHNALKNLTNIYIDYTIQIIWEL